MAGTAAVVDTSVLHAYLVEEDTLHKLAARLMNRLDAPVTPSIVLHELVWSLRRRLGPAAAGLRVARLLAGNVRVEPVTARDVWFALSDPRHYEDLLIIAVAKRLELPVATLDQHMAKLASQHNVETLSTRSKMQDLGG